MIKTNKLLESYKDSLINKISEINLDVVNDIIMEIKSASDTDRKIYIIGNGGSAATASHMVNDLGAGLRRRSLLNVNIASLSDNVPTITAISNDVGYDDIFNLQLKGIIKTNDILIAISCSGTSRNIIKAVQYSKNRGAKIIGLTGFDGGQLKEMSDISFHVPTSIGQYGIVEDIHMILDHMIYTYIIDENNLN